MRASSDRLTVGRPPVGPIQAFLEALASLRRRRRLIWYITISSLRGRGRDSVIGNLWWVLDPALNIAIYYILVVVIFARSEPAYPLFLFAGIMPWRWLSSAVSESTSVIRGRASIMRSVAFPTITLPASTVLSGFISFLFGLVPLAVLYVIYPERLTGWIFAIPLVAIAQIAWTIPLVIFISAVSMFFLDMQNIVNHGMRLWFYATPIIYSAEGLRKIAADHPPIDFLIKLNPFLWIIEGYRDLIYAGRPANWGALLGITLASLPVTFVLVYVFRRLSPYFVKVL
ncbi:MAG: hypothetical protein DWI49_02915 [Chloroflexi bacterium]|jgi:ABC-type polysaccharide/polyol phosphate export permease|nr:MAG: hypothetical protein DWI45_01230 [Chloroflexota bacterium]RLT27315.1 MAG: hypothetical protein DWI49_02915 [Chloroflexota bacterium]